MASRLRVGISLRQDFVAERDESWDSLDARWAELLWEAGFLPVALLNNIADHAEYLNALDLDAFVLSGGGEVGQPAARGRLEQTVMSHSIERHRPVFGVCRGMQAIVTACGGSLSVTDGHVGTRHAVDGPLTGKREVNSFHRLAVHPSGLPEMLQAVATCDDGTIEAIRHRERPWTAIMWHPERESPRISADVGLLTEALMGGS